MFDGKVDVERADMTDRKTKAGWAALLGAREEKLLGDSADVASPLMWAISELLASLVG
jgi:hypothetical protein